MKIRYGFVSNSSSSSFVIAVPKGTDIKAEIEKNFSLPKNHPLTNIANDVIKQILNDINIDPRNKIKNLKDFKDEFGYEDEDYEEDTGDEFVESVKEGLKRGWEVYTGSFCDDGDCLDLTSAGFDIKTKDLIFWSQDGY